MVGGSGGGSTVGGAGNPSGGAGNPGGGAGNPSGGAGNPGGGAGNPSGGGGNPSGGGGNPSGGSATGGASDVPLGTELTDLTQFTAVPDCGIDATVTAASIPMVGVAKFSTDLPGADRAIIQFGKTADYTLEAPVDWSADQHKTLMLGMTANTMWHYRIVTFSGNSACIGSDQSHQTGALPAGAPGNRTFMAGESSAMPTPSFRLVAAGSWVVIWNIEGETVWAYNFGQTTSLNMSWDGKYMYARDTGPFDEASGGSIWRVSMEGGTKETMQVMGGSHHDVVAIPTGFAYIAKSAKGQCDHVFTANPDGSGSKSLVDLDAYLAPFHVQASEKCHVNAINYHHDEGVYTLSDREKDVVIEIDATTGELIRSIGKKPDGEAPGHILAAEGGSTWRVQHGHHWYEEDKFIVFSNGSFGGGASKVLHYTVTGATAQLDWQFQPSGSPTLSNAIRLPSGNFLVMSSMGSTLYELDSMGKVVFSGSVGGSGGMGNGYARYRATLYGPPMQY